MEVVISPVTTTLSWETCPVELLWMILKRSSRKSLICCMTVNRRWKAVVLDYIERYSLWPKIISEIMLENGRTYRRKSVLGTKDMLMNSLLWSYVPLAKIDLHHTYAVQNVKRIQVNKETLILTADPYTNTRPIRYYDITKMELKKSLPNLEIEFKENDHMLVMVVNYELLAYGKEFPGDHATDIELIYALWNPILYTLEDNVCYVVDKHNVVMALTWNKEKWRLQSRGRYYGNSLDTLCGISVYNGRVCLLTKLGFVLCEDRWSKSYKKVNSFNLVATVQDSTVLELFCKYGVAVSVKNGNHLIKVCQDLNSNFIWLQCGDMTCATEHGKILFIGYKDGSVAICTPHTLLQKFIRPDRLLNVRDFDASIEDPSILGVEVFEDKLSHHLFVATKHKVLQLLITYPHHIREAYDGMLL